ncbi:hypothetical protein [Sulfobacillus thermosulfidooxidans]|uniref:hypothetical protein n=1 Tax=Sulfobacillus thermosulfidooxidans TaxID=28034 RepID=UPI00048F6790|nr:hypothetical protein [Sulfobacillus thermosulfidooxidans]
MTNTFLNFLPPNITSILLELFGHENDALSDAVRVAYYLYVEDRVPPNQWTHETFERMAGRRGWSDTETRRRWAQFQRIITKLGQEQQTPVLLRDSRDFDGTIRVSVGKAPWMLLLHCRGYYDAANLGKRLHPLRAEGWTMTDPVPVEGENDAFFVTAKRVSSNAAVYINDFVNVLTEILDMKVIPPEPTKHVNLGAPENQPSLDFTLIQSNLRLLVDTWQRFRNWLELYRQCFDSDKLRPLNTLSRIFELVSSTPAPRSIGVREVLKHMDSVMADFSRITQETTNHVEWERYWIVAQREPILRPLWQKLEIEIIQGLSSRLAVSDRDPNLFQGRRTDVQTLESWKKHVQDRFSNLTLIGEVSEEEDKLQQDVHETARWITWQAMRRRIHLGDASAVERILDSDIVPWLSQDTETCVKALEIASCQTQHGAVLTLRAMLPFSSSLAVHEAAAQAYVAREEDALALQELEGFELEELKMPTVFALATALIRQGRHEEALPYAREAIKNGWLDLPEASEMIDLLVITASLAPDVLLDFCNEIIANLKSFSRALKFESVFEYRLSLLLDTPGEDPSVIIGACEDWTDVLVANGELRAAWTAYKQFAPKLKDPLRLRWLDSLATDIPAALEEVETIAWKSANNPIVHAQAIDILRAYRIDYGPLDDTDAGTSEISLRHYSLLIAGASQNIRAQVKKRLVENYGFDPAIIAEVPSPWEGHISTTEIRALVDSHDVVVAFTAMMKHSLWHQLDVPASKVIFPPSRGVSGALQVIINRCRQPLEGGLN